MERESERVRRSSDDMIHRAYNSSKNLKKKTCACSGCGSIIAWSGSNCVGFGLYMCSSCRKEKVIL